jgi:acetyl esterase/lipase
VSIATIAEATLPAAAPVPGTPSACAPVDRAPPRYEPLDDRGYWLASYLRWLPRMSGALRYHSLMFVMARALKLGVGKDVDLVEVRDRLARTDARLFRRPAWATRRVVDTGSVVSEWIGGEHADPSRVVLYLHGGAFAFRFPQSHASFAARLGRLLGASFLLPDYRLAPEQRYPAALDDCVAAYRWLLERGTLPGQIVVGGDSAGGCLALGLLLRAAREGLPQPAAAFVFSPVADAQLGGDTIRTNAAIDPVLPADALPILRDAYLDPEHRRDPAASPLLGSYAGIAPVLVQAGTREVLLDDARRVAQRIHETGGAVVCEIWQDMPHVFPLVGLLRESPAALANVVRFVAAHAGWKGVPGGNAASRSPEST